MYQSGDEPLAMPRFEALPVVTLADETVNVRISGLRPECEVLIRARMSDDQASLWESVSTFTADAGRVDLSRQAPISGSYEGVEPMGFLWSMRTAVDGSTGPMFKTTIEPTTISLSAETDGGTIAEAKLVRLVAAPGVTRTEVRNDGLYATLFSPVGDGPHPAIILLSGSGGGLSEPQAALYASRGYCALALAYFRIGDLPADLVRIPLEYFERAVAWLQARPEVDPERLAIGGGSRGGELSLLLASRYQVFKAVVANVPSAVVYGGVGGDGGSDEPAWTYRGEGIPFLNSRRTESSDYTPGNGVPFALTPIFLRSLDDKQQVQQATIPVERINGPVLAISGMDDAMWPSSVFGDMIMDRLSEHRHPFPDKHLAYEGTGHIISQPWWPTTVTASVHPVTKTLFAYGGEARAVAHARANAWQDILNFLDVYLKERKDKV